MKKINSRLTTKRELSYNTNNSKKRAMKNHPVHIMKIQSSTVEEVFVGGSSLKRTQKRVVIRYACICKEEDIFYRQVDHPAMTSEEYTKPAK